MSTITTTLKTTDAFYRVSPDGFCHKLPDTLGSIAQYIRDENACPDDILTRTAALSAALLKPLKG
jgi:hypothetical protein